MGGIINQESKHTPGPWHVHGGWGYMVRAGEASVAECRQQLKHSEIVANAKLIAAAPSLLAACRELLEAMDEYEWSVDDAPTPQHREMMLRAMKAVEDAS